MSQDRRTEPVLIRLPVEPGWRLCDADPLPDFDEAGRVRAVCEPLTAVVMCGEAIGSRPRMFADSGIHLVGLRSSGKACSSVARFYGPDDQRSTEDLLDEYIAELRKEPLPMRVHDELVASKEAVPQAAAPEQDQARRVVCPSQPGSTT